MQQIRFQNLGARPGCADTHVTRLRPGQVSAAHTHDFHETFLVLEGAGVHHLNRRRLPLREGHLVIIQPSDAHWYSTEGGLVFVNVAVSAPWQQAFDTLHGLAPWADATRTLALDRPQSRALGSELSSALLAEDPAAAVRAWARVHEYFTRPAGPRPPAWLETLRRRLAERPESLVEPIGFWQRSSGRSAEHLARSCRRFYGVTFSELINQARIERARYLLRTTDDKVITVAFDCGFQNMANFHRVFARLSGQTTPSRWRRQGATAVPVRL